MLDCSYITIAPTHKACKLIGGTTTHRTFDINPTDFNEFKKAVALKDAGVKFILTDEINMISNKLFCILDHLKT